MSETVSREEFEALKMELAALRAQVAALTPAPPADEPISEEVLAVISAAVAAFLGKRATVKIVRRIHDESSAWRTNGRASLAASHELPAVRGW